MLLILLYAVGLSLALGAGEASASADTPSGAVIEIVSPQDQGSLIPGLGLVQPPADSDRPAQAPSPASTASSAEAVPELPTWAMMLLCLVGLGLAGFKRGRKDRLSPGIE